MLHTTFLNTHSHGAGNDHRILVTSRVHAGTKPTLDKLVDLVLTDDQAFELVIEVLGKLPAIPLSSNREKFDRLKRLMNAIPEPEEEPK